MPSSTSPASIQSLPLDIVTDNLIARLSYSSLVNLSSTSKSLHATLSTSTIWQAYLRHQNYTDITQSKYLSSLPVRARAAKSNRAEIGWENHTFKLTGLFPQRWQRKCLPRLEIDSEFIAVGVGSDMHIHWIPDKKFYEREVTKQFMVYQLGKHGSEDITEIIALPGLPQEFIIGQANGWIRHLEFSKNERTFTIKRVFQHPTAVIRSLSLTQDYLVSLSSTSSNTHQITVYRLSKPEEESEIYPLCTVPSSTFESEISTKGQETGDLVQPRFTTNYPTRPWKSLFLSPTVLALGSTIPHALVIYDFHPDSTNPLQKSRELLSHAAILWGVSPNLQFEKTAIYALHKYSPSLLLSGWYHGPANIHDLRLPTEYPTIALNDPLDDGAAYSVTTDGGNRVLVGGFNHGLVKVFDIRMPNKGWSIYLARERSPIYAIKAEHSRFFAATEGEVWECDMTYRHQHKKYEDWNWRMRWLGRTPRTWEDRAGAQVRLHHGKKEALYREDGSIVGQSSTAGFTLH